MRKLLLLFALILPFGGYSQVAVTSANGQNVENLLNEHFLGGGVVISNARFNGQAVINSNAIGTFTNETTEAPNVGSSAGIVMVTGDCMDASAGQSLGIVSTNASPASDGDGVSPALALTLRGQGNTQDMNDVAVLQFDFIPSGEYVSFKYVFASEEYPGFVCSSFNDIFGFFISGPYDENGNPVDMGHTPYQFRNIAVIPGSTDPVTINTVNGGTSAGSASPCVLTNTQYFRTNTNNNCKMNGYTIELETEEVFVVPCYKYKLELAICDVGDHAYNSAVFLSANSFRVDELSLSRPEPGSDGVVEDFVKGCDHYDLTMTINRPANANETHMLELAGDAVKDVDYRLTDLNGNPVGETLTFVEGESTATVRVEFLSSPADVEGERKTLIVMTEFINECAKQDTVTLNMVAPAPFIHTLYRQTDDEGNTMELDGQVVYCNDVLPVSETLIMDAQGGVGDVTYEWSNGGSTSETNTFVVDNPMELFVKATDACGRELYDTVEFKINTATTTASVDRAYICEGDIVTLSCPEAVEYVWTSTPEDSLLATNNDVREPQAQPKQNTTYTVEITDAFTCKATASVSVNVVPSLKAELFLTPTRTTTTNTTVRFEDRTVGSFSREWDFGDGNTSEALSGYNVYPAGDTGTYEVRLIAYNQADCPDTAYGVVQIVPEFAIWLPNAFTPGSDDVNATFGPSFSVEKEYELVIYSRNGGKIFRSTPEVKRWDGKYEGGDYVPNGVYIYDIMYRDGENRLQRKTGTVTVILNEKE